MSKKPAVLGGGPICSQPLNFVRPKLPQLDELAPEYNQILSTGMVTTGPNADALGNTLAGWMGVKKAVAVSSCTTGLMLVTQALKLPQGSEVIMPSFTFMATALGPVWNQLKPRFVDVDPETMNIDPEAVEAAVNSKTSAIVGVHQFGAPAEIEKLQSIADKHALTLYFDSAHGLGSLHQGKPLGCFGRAEVFSMSPTKVMIAGEGGIVATNDETIGEAVYYGRNYANPGNYDCLFPGMNARMSEFHAILALHSFKMLEDAVTHRNRMVDYYKKQLGDIPGISFQKILEGDRSSYKDFSIVVDDEDFGLGQSELQHALKAEGIGSRVYYKPVLHEMTAFAQYAEGLSVDELENTVYLSNHALSLPLYSDMRECEVDQVCEAFHRIHKHASEIRKM